MDKTSLTSLIAVSAFVSAVFGGATTNKWTDATVHDSIFNAADWHSDNSWDPAGAPNGSTADAWLPDRTHYITNSQPVSLYSLRNIEGVGGNRFVYVSDEPITFYTIKTATWRVGGGRFYAPAHFAGGGETYLGTVEFCGDVVCDDTVSGPFGHSQKVEWRFDKFANAAGEVRTAYPLDAAIRTYNNLFSFYAPQSSATNLTYAYKLIAGSPYVKKVASAANPVIPAGTIVTGAGVPSGTFVKRIFPDWSLELSAPATAAADSTPLTFAAFTPKVYQYIRSFSQNSSVCLEGIKAMKSRAEDEIEIEIGTLGLNPKAGVFICFQTEAGYLPGLITIHTSTSANASGYPVRLDTCHLNFSTSTSKYGPGLPTAVVTQGAGGDTRLTVTNGISARIGCFTNLVGSVVKDGVGDLEIGLTNLVASNTGRLVAEAGRLAISSDAALEPAYVGALAVSNGATFKLPAQGIRTSAFAFEPGAVIAGPGTLYVPEAQDGCRGLVFTDGARISFDKATEVVRTQTDEDTLPGNPAFWVDCSNLDTITYTTVNGSNLVSRINDVRKQSDDDGYLFSTNASGPNSDWKPCLREEERSGLHYVHFYGNYTNYVYAAGAPKGNPALSDTHVWSEPVRNIHVVFQAFEPGPSPKGNCPFLGATASYSRYADELNRYGNAYTGNIFDWAHEDINYWQLAINGEPADNAKGYPYEASIPYSGYAPVYRFVPFTMSLRVVPGAPDRVHPGANSYDYCAGYSNQNKGGGKMLGELIVYTNDLTDVEFHRVTAYLMKKWNAVSYQYAPMQSGGQPLGTVGTNLASAVSVQEGSAMLVDAFTGEGTFEKNGKGELVVSGVEAGASLKVNDGTLEIKSRRLDSSLVPTGAYRWYDAEKASAFTYSVDERGVTNISSWADARGTVGYEATLKESASTNRPTLRSFAALGGKPAVDFGEVIRWPNNSSIDWTAAPSLVYTDSGVTLHTVIAVWGSEHGGGNLVGSPYTSHYKASEYTLVREGTNDSLIGADKDKAIIQTMTFPHTASYERGTRFQLNGVRCNPNTTGLSGSFDLVSYVGYEPFGSAGMSGVNNVPQWVGGEQFAEYLLFQRGLSEQEVADVEAYLNKKWFGRSTQGYGQVVLGDVTVAEGATLRITGNAPAKVASLGGAGTIEGAVELADNASFAVVVAEDGSCSKLSVGSIDVTKPLTLNFSGYVRLFALGEHVVMESPSITAGTALNWRSAGLAGNRACSFRAENGRVVATVTSGLVISFR